MNWVRVNRANKCPICGHDSWCVYSEDVVLCMRQQSERSFTSRSGEVGWVHQLTDKPRYVTKEKPRPAPEINCKQLIGDWSSQTRGGWLQRFGQSLGMTDKSLLSLNCCWASPHNAWAFPMRDGYGNWVGIRLRSESGQKWAVPGSHQGLFYDPKSVNGTILITEGPTDTAAAIELGHAAVGRPSCSGGVPEIQALERKHLFRRVVIISDNDTPGLMGAGMLQRYLKCPTTVMVLPCKDLRDFVRLGGTKELLNSMIETSVWSVK